MYPFRFGVALVFLALLGCAHAPADGDATARMLAAQAEAWDQAIVRKDRAAIEANMAADFRQVDARGRRATRAEFLDGITSPRLEIDPYTVEDLELKLLGDTVLVSGTTRMTGRWDGKPFASHYRYTDVYAREAGAWKVVSVQVTEIAE